MIEQKLHELGVIISNDNDTVHNEAELLREYEALTGHTLPVTYRHFLLKFKTSMFFDNMIVYRPLESSPWDSDGTQGLDEFYGLTLGANQDSGLSTLPKKYSTYLDRVPYSVVPIAEAPGGNQICLGVESPVEGKIFFWDHEDEREIMGEHKNDFENMYLIANTFEDFIGSLMIDNSAPDSDDDDGIVSTWFSDDLDL